MHIEAAETEPVRLYYRLLFFFGFGSNMQEVKLNLGINSIGNKIMTLYIISIH